MKQNIALLTLLLVLLCFGCGKPPMASIPIQSTIVKDTTITPDAIVMHDTVRLQVDCDQNGVGTIRPIIKTSKTPSRQGYLQVAGAKNELLLSSTFIPPPVTVPRVESIQVVQKEVDKPVPYVPRYYKFQHWVAVAFEVSLLGYAGFKLSRFG